MRSQMLNIRKLLIYYLGNKRSDPCMHQATQQGQGIPIQDGCIGRVWCGSGQSVGTVLVHLPQLCNI